MARVKLPDNFDLPNANGLTALNGTSRWLNADTGAAVNVYSARTGGTTNGAGTATITNGKAIGWVDSGAALQYYVTPSGSTEQGPFYWEAAAGIGLTGGQIFQTTTSRDATLATDFHGLFNIPSATGISTMDDYADSSSTSTTIYQLSGAVYNTGTRPAVAVAGFARGKSVWGSNLVVMADGSSSAATGLEIDFGIVTASTGQAIGLALHSHNASGNPGMYLQMLARYGLDTPAPRAGIQISVNGGTDQPLQSTGVIFETSGAVQTAYGLDFHSSAFTQAAAYLPVNPSPGTSTKGIVLENRGGATNTQAMMQFSSTDATSKSTYGIRFVSAAGVNPPITSSGKLIYVDGGTYGQALDISAATFAASGAIVMGDNNISFGTTTGTKIGTAATQKLAFYNSTPIAQYATTGTSVGFTAGAGTTATSLSTYTGNTGATAYTVGDVVRALKQLGLVAA